MADDLPLDAPTPAANGPAARGASPVPPAGRATRAIDPITALALQRVREAHPHERLLTIKGWTMAELAKRVDPPVSRSRLADLFAQAEAYGRLSEAWAARLAHAVGVDAQDVLDLFGISEPSRTGRPRTGRPRTRRSA